MTYLSILAPTGDKLSWWRPTTLDQLLQLKTSFPTAKIVVGNTEVRVPYRHIVVASRCTRWLDGWIDALRAAQLVGWLAGWLADALVYRGMSTQHSYACAHDCR